MSNKRKKKRTRWETTASLVSKTFRHSDPLPIEIEYIINEDVSEALIDTCINFNIPPSITNDILITCAKNYRRTRNNALKLSKSVIIIAKCLEEISPIIKKYFLNLFEVICFSK